MVNNELANDRRACEIIDWNDYKQYIQCIHSLFHMYGWCFLTDEPNFILNSMLSPVHCVDAAHHNFVDIFREYRINTPVAYMYIV